MRLLEHLGLCALVAGLTFVSGVSAPFTAIAQAQRLPVAADIAGAQELVPGEDDPRAAAAARHLERIQRLLRGRTSSNPHASARSEAPLVLGRKIVSELDGLTSLELVLEQSAIRQRAGMARLHLPSQAQTRFDAQQREVGLRAASFRVFAGRLQRAVAAGASTEASAALDALAKELEATDVTRRPVLDPRSVREQLVRRERRAPAVTSVELQRFLAPTTRTTVAPDTAVAADFMAATAKPVLAPELVGTGETAITPRIQALADQLDHNPVRIYNWVRNEIDFVPTHGAIQGADLTLVNRHGNAADTNSLLAALLRASGIPTRFVYGTVDVPMAQATNWLKAKDVDDALGLVQVGGIPSTLIRLDGQAHALRLQHLWVEAYVDFTPSRGAINRVPETWVPLDASFKQYAHGAALDILGLSDWSAQQAAAALQQDAQFSTDGSFTGLDTSAYQAYVHQAVDRAMQSSAAAGLTSAEQGLGQYTIVASALPVLTGTLPFSVSAATARFAALPSSLKYYVDVNLYRQANDIVYENPDLSLRIATVDLGGRSLYVDYVPATESDALGLGAYAQSNAASLPLGSFDVIPTVRLGDQVLGQGSAVAMGTQQFWTAGVRDLQGHVSGAWEPYRFAAGSRISFTPNLGGVSQAWLDENFEPLPESSEQPVDVALHLAGIQYWYLTDSRDALYARGAGGHFLRLPSMGAFAAPLQVRYFFGIPRSGSFTGFATDVKADRMGILHGDPAVGVRLAASLGANGSLAEGLTWDALLSGRAGKALSSSSILLWANRARVPIHTITADNVDTVLAGIQTTSDVKDEIRNAVTAGMQVLIPQKEFSDGKVTAAGYVIVDPQTGAAVYRVDGGMNGAINVGCIAKAVLLKVVCNSKFARLLRQALLRLGERIVATAAVQGMLAVVAPPLAVLLPIVDAVLIGVTILQVAYEVWLWVNEVMNGTIDLTPEELALAGIKAVNDYACNYMPACFASIPGFGILNSAAGEVMGYSPVEAAPGGGVAGNPVAIANGVKLQVELDYEGKGPFPLTYARTYVSYLPNGSPVGHKWISTYHHALRLPDGATAMAPPEAVLAQRADGGWQQYVYRSGQYVANGDVPERIERVTDGLGRTTGWWLHTVDDTTEHYDADGRLLFIENRNGLRQTLRYDAEGHLLDVSDDYGRRLGFEYEATGQVAALVDPEGRRTTYGYQDGALVSVTRPDGSVRRYHYEMPGWPTLLTGITDERGIRFASWRYDDDNRVVESTHANGADRTTFRYGDNQTTVTDPHGGSRTYRFTRLFDSLRTVQVSDPCSSCSGGGTSSIQYDGNAHPVLLTDFNGNQTRMQVDARGLPLSWTRGYGKPEARTISVQWHALWRLPVSITETGATGTARTIRFDYDERGNLARRTIAVDGQSRVWTYASNAAGQVIQVDGPRSDVEDITRYGYDGATGNRSSATDPNGLTTLYTRYDVHGHLLQMVDPNGLTTDYAYDNRDRLIESRVSMPGSAVPETTRFAYNAVDQLERLTLPDGSWLHYAYDDAQQLVTVDDSLGNRVGYTLDAAGERVQEETFDPQGRLAQTMHRVFDALGRLRQAYGTAPGEATIYAYDGNGNELSAQSPLHAAAAESRYDALDRLVATVDPLQGSIGYRYDTRGNLREVTDPRGLSTQYGYDGFDELTSLSSPDTGVARYGYDAAGNLVSREDARDVDASYRYDAANRLLGVTYPDETLVYTYDEPAGGAGAKGRLTTLADGSGRTRFVYDAQGRLLQKVQQLGGDANAAGRRTLAYSYSRGLRDQSVLPSGAVIGYRYGADGRVVELSVNGQVLLRDVEYFPFGEPKGWTTVAGRYTREFDGDGRIASYSRGAGSAHIGYDQASRVTSIAEDGAGRPHWTYGYDDLDRLRSAHNAETSGPLAETGLEWEYDATGNRLLQQTTVAGTSQTTAYTIDPASNRLTAVDGAVRSYDAVGNTTLADGRTYVYSGRNRLVEVRLGAAVQAHYAYNGLGERVCVATGSGACPSNSGGAGSGYQQFVYDEAGHLVGEYDASGALIAEHVWLDDTPVAVLKPAATASVFGGMPAGNVAAYFVQPDHLDTPRAIINAGAQVVWSWDSPPFGNGSADSNPSNARAFDYNLRFPGQQAGGGMQYNYHRDYEPADGRYLQADPIGLEGGLNAYAYALNSPLVYFDDLGLSALTPILRLTGRLDRKMDRSMGNRSIVDCECNRKTVADAIKEDPIPHMTSGRNGLRNPPGTEWHHPKDYLNEVWLVRTCDHRAYHKEHRLGGIALGGGKR